MFVVLRHEFRQKMKSKTFVIMTFIAPLLLGVVIAVPVLVTTMNEGSTKQLIVVDSTGKLGKYFTQPESKASRGFKGDESKQPSIMARSLKVEVLSFVTPRQLDSLKKQLLDKNIFGYLIIPASAISDSSSNAILRVTNANDFSSQEFITSRFKDGLFSERLKSSGVDPQFVQKAHSGAEVETLKVSEEKETEDSGIGFGAGYITGMILYVAMLLYGSLIMQSVIEEKNSRVIELLTSCIKPMDLLIGKVLGVGLAGMLQVSVWAIMFATLSFFALPYILLSLGPAAAHVISPISFIYFIFYFIFGYLMYATLYAGAGATVEQVSDAQQVSMPITILIILPILMMTSVMQSPSSTSSVILSLIPFFSPILMVGRIFSEMPPWWQIALSFVLMGATFFGVLWLAGKIYRTGILMYGKKYSLKEIFRWLKYS